MICEVVKPKKVCVVYSGPCRVPGCPQMAYARGVCRFHHGEIWRADPYGRSHLKREMERLGIMVPRYRPSKPFIDPGISLEVMNYPEGKWLPLCACEYFGRRLPEKMTPQKKTAKWTRDIKEGQTEWEAAMEFARAIDWQQFPVFILERFGDLTEADLSGMAWRATDFSPGTHERMFVYHLRQIFGCNFSRNRRRCGFFHPDDSREPGNGTHLDRYIAESVAEPGVYMDESTDDLGE